MLMRRWRSLAPISEGSIPRLDVEVRPEDFCQN